MNYLWVCVFAAVAAQCVHGSSEIDLLNDDYKLKYTLNCTQQGLYCKSCTELVMCIETEYGWTEQPVANCTGRYSCLQDHCTSNVNVFCNEAAKMPFKCHVPGAFPDPFDCQSYHLCVLTTEYNSTTEVLKDFKHTCSNEGPQRYRYDAKSTYCKYELDSRCPLYLTPVCLNAGQSGSLIENDSIYYVCEQIGDVLYPNLYSCPHGRRYIFKRCMKESEITTTAAPPTTHDWSTTVDWSVTWGPTTIPPTYPVTWGPTTYTPTWRPTTYPPTWPTTIRPTYPPTWGPTTYPPTWGPTTYPPTSRPTTDSSTWGPTTSTYPWDTQSTPGYTTTSTYPWDTQSTPGYTTTSTYPWDTQSTPGYTTTSTYPWDTQSTPAYTTSWPTPTPDYTTTPPYTRRGTK